MPEFRLTEDHLRLLRRARVVWNGDEYGAPGLCPKRPFGNSDVAADILAIPGWVDPGPDDPVGQELRDLARELHRELKTALQIVLRFAGIEVEPGLYRQRREGDRLSWEKAGD